MTGKAASDLGLDKVLETVSHYALSPAGAKKVQLAHPVTERDVWLERQEQVDSAVKAQILAREQGLDAEYFPDLTGLFDSITRSPSALDGEQIYNAGVFIKSAERLRDILQLAEDPPENLPGNPFGNVPENLPEYLPEKPLAGGIADCIDAQLEELEREIFRILDSPGQVKENYPTLKALRKKEENIRLERTRTAAELMRKNTGLVQGDSAVLRDGRIMLPVRVESKSRIEGYVQGQSQSGATVFIEPFRLVDMNNAVVLARQEIELEIARLLGQLSTLVRAAEQKLRILVSKTADADFLYAFAAWVQEYGCCRVLEAEDCTCSLIQARHPLLGKGCVPVDLKTGPGVRAVVLTGPNAGGKTVTIKTVGLFALLNQICGHIPAADGSSLALFDRVFTDIGDDQSIENKLSTFSGHMKSVGFILRSITGKSLVILDELGSGTDPQEGAALARAILEYCSERALLTLVTSHHGVLKQFAYSSDKVLNASMEFDGRTMEPTFRVISGLPGDSHAIDTARRMRLPSVVTSAALSYLGREAVKISTIIRDLEQKRLEAQRLEAELSARAAEAENREKMLASEERRLKAVENRLKTQELREFDSFVSESRKTLEGLVKELREGEITKEKTRRVKEHILELEKQRGALAEEIEQRELELDRQAVEEMEQSAQNVELKPGMDVLCGPGKREGTVVRREKNGKWQVAIGPMKFTFKETELSVPRRAGSEKSAALRYSFEAGSKTPVPKPVLDVRGYRLDEALDEIDSQIEACCVHGVKDFSVIHGYGEGILSTGIHRHLKTHGAVANYGFARPEDGGNGKTYVELRI